MSLLKPKTILKFCFLRMPELRKLMFCIWITRLRSVRPVNGLVGHVDIFFSNYYNLQSVYFELVVNFSSL